MLNLRPLMSRKNLLLVLVLTSGAAIANAIFSLEHDWHLLSISTLAIGGALLYSNIRKSIDANDERSQVIDRSYLQKQLQQLQASIHKIADLAQRETLRTQAQQITDNLQKNHFRIVIFGTGASGKTSVINALMGRNAGDTAPTIGTTTASQAHPYPSLDISPVGIAPISPEPKIKRHISLIDTSGIQEAGSLGQQREAEALHLARNADLMIFVTAGDLTNTEYRELESLAALKKRIILAFNKTDLYLPSDRQLILEQLKAHTQHFLAELDIVAIAAQPSPIKVRQYANDDDANHSQAMQEWWEQLPADISALKSRIEAILSNEWEELLIRNTHLQIEQLWQQVQGAVNQQRRQDAAIVINRYQIIAATTVFANPIPALDLLAGAAINTQMLLDLAKIYDRPLNFKQGQKLAMEIAQQLLQLGCVEIATSAIASFFKVNALTYAIGGSVQAVTAAYLTHIGGNSFIEFLEQSPQSETSPASLIDNAKSLQDLQKVCQRTFAALQGDRFLGDFISNISHHIQSKTAIARS